MTRPSVAPFPSYLAGYRETVGDDDDDEPETEQAIRAARDRAWIDAYLRRHGVA